MSCLNSTGVSLANTCRGLCTYYTNSGEFKVAHSLIKIKGVLADALYGEKAFMDEAAKESGGSQVISQLRKTRCSSF
ncbi:hypothetical protein [Bathymodiolus japonicus methanotrophic gill symbiont]|uniref:hypothetical protein n=1 Tax=Bathymodiolus japonicus methanotrophic gill symbiont TaxID=113269 RepID=UPI001C8D7C1B|nr:hypothetical protein [Bathymodiolus japonicus methanotrophic gill symbiont]